VHVADPPTTSKRVGSSSRRGDAHLEHASDRVLAGKQPGRRLAVATGVPPRRSDSVKRRRGWRMYLPEVVGRGRVVDDAQALREDCGRSGTLAIDLAVLGRRQRRDQGGRGDAGSARSRSSSTP
jgi:hypothetical protein